MKKKSEQSKLAYLKRLVPCEVCGMSSSGRHYGAFSCEGCRNFFKRSLVAHPFYSCRHSPDTVSSNCKLCRFNACLAAGMSMAAVRVGRPTADERAAVSAYLTQLETQKRLLPEPIMRKRQRRKSSLNATGLSSSGSSTMDGDEMTTSTSIDGSSSAAAAAVLSGANGSAEGLMVEFERRIVDAARTFNTYFITNSSTQLPITLDWQMTPQIIWSQLAGSAFDSHITATADFTRNLPGFSKVAVADRVTLFAWSLFPLVATRCFCKAVMSNPGATPEQVAFEAICDFFSLERTGTSWQIAKELVGEPLRQLESVFIEASRLFVELRPSESEFALIYALIFFAINESSSQLEDSRRAALIGNVYTAISEAMAERFQSIQLQSNNHNSYHNNQSSALILSGKRRASAFYALVKLLRRTTELIGGIQQYQQHSSSAATTYQCGTNLMNRNTTSSSFFFDEVMKLVLGANGQTSPTPPTSCSTFNNNNNNYSSTQHQQQQQQHHVTLFDGNCSEVPNQPTYFLMTPSNKLA